MKPNEFTDRITFLVKEYLNSPSQFDENVQIQVNPANLMATLADNRAMLESIEYSDEAVEEAAGAERASYEDAMDAQVRRNPDFYPLRTLLKHLPDGRTVPDADAIGRVAARYF